MANFGLSLVIILTLKNSYDLIGILLKHKILPSVTSWATARALFDFRLCYLHQLKAFGFTFPRMSLEFCVYLLINNYVQKKLKNVYCHAKYAAYCSL